MKSEKENPPKETDSAKTVCSPAKLTTLDKDISKHKLKVVFTAISGKAGERALLDRGLATMYEKQGTVKIIK